MREKEVEQALVRSVRKAGGLCMKFICPGVDGAGQTCASTFWEVCLCGIKGSR